MTEIKKKYKIIRVLFFEARNIIGLSLESTEKQPQMPIVAPPGGSDEERMMGKIIQSTFQQIQQMVPYQYQEKPYLNIELSQEDYEKLGRPGILDEITLTLDYVKEAQP